MKKTVTSIFIILFICLFCFGGFKIFEIYSEQKQGTDTYSELEQFEPHPKSAEETHADIKEPAWDYKELEEINPDLWGWITIDGTTVNYPVVQGEDNEYYLRHMFSGEWNKSGSIFLDAFASPDLNDSHTIIFGHHMKNNAMFSAIANYKTQKFYDSHKTAQLFTKEKEYELVFFSGYVSNTKSNAWQTSFENEESYSNWISEINEKSMFKSDIIPSNTDKIVTLSTCSYEFDDARFVLHAVLREVE